MSLLLLSGREVSDLLAGQETEILHAVRRAYEAHARNQTALPFSTFLRFPADDKNRVIALPAYLGDSFNVAGIKWIASFPGNIERHMNRASAVIILNSTQTGRPEAIIEGSIISAKRTAASAALAARHLHAGRSFESIGLLGCGLINFEIERFLLSVFPEIRRVRLYDIDPERARRSKRKSEQTFKEIVTETVDDIKTLFETCTLVSIATTATEPHIDDLGRLAAGGTVLHVSLRDLSPELILACDNVVDDVEHVCCHQTSVHLAEQLTSRRDFIRCNLADIMAGAAPARAGDGRAVVFSPFGLGILDIAVSEFVFARALREDVGTAMASFLPANWLERT